MVDEEAVPSVRGTGPLKIGVAQAASTQSVQAWHKGIAALAAHLRAEEGPDVWVVGGAMLQSALLDRRALDRLELFVMPVLLGSGVPLFRRLVNQPAISLRSAQGLAGGVVKLDYHFGPPPGSGKESP